LSAFRKLQIPPIEIAYEGEICVKSQGFSLPVTFRKLSRLDMVNLPGYLEDLVDMYAWRPDESGVLKLQPPVLCRDAKDDLFKVSRSMCELIAVFMVSAVWGRQSPLGFEDWALMAAIPESCDQLLQISALIKEGMIEVTNEISDAGSTESN
jgi:hypothetical protein